MSALTIANVLKDMLGGSNELADPRMNLFLMRSSYEYISILALYCIVVLKIGPKFMELVKAYTLKDTITVYNVLQIFLNAYVFVILFRAVKNNSIWCAPPDKSNSEANLLELRGHYFYVLLKYLDLVETVFYVLRKKNRQISFLHVYHHIGILFAAWVSGKYFPGGQALYLGLYNTAIHCLMYCYYLASSWSPNNKKIIWWKKYVTVLQIIQHCMIFVSIIPAVVNTNCSYPKQWITLLAINVLVMIYLFVKFYKDTYLGEKKVKDT